MHAETVLYASLTDVDALEELADTGLDPACIPTTGMRDVVTWAVEYFYRSGRTKAPSRELLQEQWGHRLEQCSIELPDEDLEVDEVFAAIEYLQSQYVLAESQRLQREIAVELAQAEPHERVEAVHRAAASFHDLSMSVRNRKDEVEGVQGLKDSLARYDQRASAPQVVTGMSVGMKEVDQHTLGIHEGEICAWCAPPKGAKAQPLSTPVLTPTGWTTMGEIKPGDKVVGSDGRPTVVTQVHPQGRVPVYRVSVSDGSSTVCCGDHLWLVQTHDDRQARRPGRVLNTKQIQALLASGKKRHTYLPMVDPVEFAPGAPLPLDAYGLGLLLGDGTFRGGTPAFCKPEPELHSSLAQAFPMIRVNVYDQERGQALLSGHNHGVNPLKDTLLQLGLWGLYSHEKFIPEPYLRARFSDRLGLLQGLMDTDGHVDLNDLSNTGTTFTTTSAALADGVQELVESLGGTCRRRIQKAPRHQGGIGLPAHTLRITLHPGYVPFRLSRKADAWKAGRTKTNRVPVRQITAIEPVGEEEAQCITVEAADHLYVTERYLVTHNSWSASHVAHTEWKRGRVTVLYTLENSVTMTYDRLACQICGVDYREYQKGTAPADDVDRVRTWLTENEADLKDGLHILSPDTALRTPTALIRQAQSYGAKSVIIDQLSHIQHPRPNERRPKYETIAEIMNELATLITTGRYNPPVFLNCQINREGVAAAQKAGRLELQHIADSSAIERYSSWVFGLLRSETEVAAGMATLQMLASRRMDLTNWRCAWEPWYGVQHVLGEVSL